MKKLMILSLIAFSVIACGKKGATTSSSSTVAASPEEGVWRTTCSKCHGLGGKHAPNMFSAAEWIGIVDKMQKKRGGNQFTDDQKAQILKYLSANAKN